MKIGFSRAPITSALLIAIAVVWFAAPAPPAFDRHQELVTKGAVVPGLIEDGQLWRLFTAMFLHASWLHWAVNSWALYQLGMLYEAMFGSKRFALIYFASGIVASTASSMNIETASVGASGAIFGVLGAFIFSIRRSPQWRHEPWTRSLLGQLIFFAVLNLYIGFQVPFIDNTAHVAGLVTGLLLGFLPHRVPPPPPSHTVVDVQPYDDSPLRKDQP
ncbi:MAG TPA: rhomboid family intramembrane serine protease [Thermoanaerobaculia bacterium]|nr:rhomboid family intramembrane serine protease [Thermoanaerobaculia bacterium]